MSLVEQKDERAFIFFLTTHWLANAARKMVPRAGERIWKNVDPNLARSVDFSTRVRKNHPEVLSELTTQLRRQHGKYSAAGVLVMLVLPD